MRLPTPSKQRQNRARHRGAPCAALNWIIARAGYLRLPGKGASQAQQDRDRYECHSWAVNQTGFDPSRAQASAPSPPPSNQPLPPQGHVVRGAGRGAALGAVGGAIAGDAGKGAAAGAAMGGLAGGMRRRQQRLQQNQQQQATSHAVADSQQSQRTAYHRAMAACLTGRGYTVN
jgi:hypothetical protein